MNKPYSTRKSDGRDYKVINLGKKENGKGYYTKTIYRGKNESKKAFIERIKKEELEALTCPEPYQNYTLEECSKMWLNSRMGVTDNTLDTYQHHLNSLAPIAKLSMNKIKVATVEKFYKDRLNEVNNGGLYAVHWMLNSIFEYAMYNDLIRENIMVKVRRPKITHKKRRALTEEETKAVFDSFEDFTPLEKAYVGIAYYTGMRKGEILALTKKDICLNKGYIDVHKTVVDYTGNRGGIQEHTKSSAGMRQIPILKPLRSILEDYLNGINDDRLFVSRNGRYLQASSFNAKWKKIRNKINKHMPNGETTDITSHYFRHNFATMLIYAGVPVKTVQAILGHESVDMTLNIYAEAKIDHEDVNKRMMEYLK